MTETVASQLPLWPVQESLARLSDPTFTGNKSVSMHRWVNWIAGFSADFVSSALDRYLGPESVGRATVLDPFAGVGTTNIEALRRGFHTYGFELNPFAALAAQCKLKAAQLDVDLFIETMDRYKRFMKPCEQEIDNWQQAGGAHQAPYQGSPPHSRPPQFFRTREPFYSPAVELKVLFTLDFIKSISEQNVRDYFLLAFGSTMISYSNYSYEPSLCSRVKLGKPLVENESVSAITLAKLQQMLHDAMVLKQELERLPEIPEGVIYSKTFFDALDDLQAESVDLLITSPPYLNNYHYVRNTRPQLYWLGFVESPKDLKPFETNSFGKFWQTVREAKPIQLDFELPSLQAQLAELRGLNLDKGIYGGGGWANYAASYFNDSYRFLAIVAQLLKPGGHAVIVVGNSLLQGIEFQVDEILAQIGDLQGLDSTIERIRSKRVGNSIVGTGLRQKPQNGRPELYEAAVVLRR